MSQVYYIIVTVHPVIWFNCLSVLLYAIYNNHPEQKRHRKMKEKSAGRSNLADLFCALFTKATCQQIISCCEILQFKKINFCFSFFPYAFRSILAVFPLPALPFFSDSPYAAYISLGNVLYSTPYYLTSIILIISFLNFFTSYIHLRLSRSANFSIVFDVLLYIQILFISITRTCA